MLKDNAKQAYIQYKALTKAKEKSRNSYRKTTFKNRILKLRRSQPNPKTGGYFVSNNGLVTNSGLRFDEPIDVETFRKIELEDGDKVYFERGQIYNWLEYDITTNNNTVGAYGSGADPIFRGSTDFGSAVWTPETGGYYSTPLATIPLWVYKDGQEARRGESAFINVTTRVDDNSLQASTAVLQAYNAVEPLAGGSGSPAARMSGKEFDFRWSYPTTVTAYNGTNQLDFSQNNTGFAAGTGFRLHGQKQFATEEGDWWYDDANDKLWIKTASSPSGTDIRVVTQNHAFYLDEVDGTTITGLEFTQYYETAIESFRSDNTTITDFYIHDIRGNGLMLYGNSTGYSVTSGEIERCSLNGIHIGALQSGTFDNLEVHDINVAPNYGWPHDGYWRKTSGTAFCMFDDQNETIKLPNNLEITNFHFYNLGYQGINLHGDNHHIQFFEINNFCNRFADGAGIHSFYRDDLGAGESTSGNVYEDGSVHDGIGSNEGLTGARPPVVTGIYADNGTNNTTIDNVQVYRNNWFGIYANWNTEETKISNCLVATNGSGPAQIFFYELPDVTNSPNFLNNYKNSITNTTVVSSGIGNVAVASASDGSGSNASYNPFTSAVTGTDNNVYYTLAKQHTSTSNPVAINAAFRHAASVTPFNSVQPTSVYTQLTLAGWQSRNSSDAASTSNGFYLDAFGMTYDPAQVLVLDNPSGSSALVDIPDGMYNDLAGSTINDATVPAWSAVPAVIKSSNYYVMDSFTGTAGASISGRTPTIGPANANVISGTHAVGSGGTMTSSVNGLVSWNTGQSDFIYEAFSFITNLVSINRYDFRLADNTSSTTHRLILDFTGTDIRLREYDGSATPNNTWTAPFTLAINTSYRILVALNGASVKVYVDGVLYLNQTTTVTTGNYVAVFGETTRFTSVFAVYPPYPSYP